MFLYTVTVSSLKSHASTLKLEAKYFSENRYPPIREDKDVLILKIKKYGHSSTDS
jgi:hypothetical protein